jgi:hypothetical protein
MTDKSVFGVYEWAKHSANCISGCKNDCRYCYSKANAIKYKIKTKENWAQEIVIQKAVDKKYYKKDGITMFPTCHDIGIENLDSCFIVLKKILSAGNKVLIVSKPHLNCISHLCKNLQEYKDNILFRFTIGSADDKILKFWEPNAPAYSERMTSLILAYNCEFKTSVSSEPMLDDNIYKVVEETLPYITDAIWIGKANNLINRLILNGHKDDADIMYNAFMLVKQQSNDKFIKHIYEFYKNNPKIKWKDSIKQVIGLKRPTEKGLDI